MPTWTNQDGTKTAINPRKSRREMDKRLAAIRKTLAAIGVELEKYESLHSPNWGHVRQVAHVDELLAEVYDFMRGAE